MTTSTLRSVHELKTWPVPFDAVYKGIKRHEVRTTGDRKFAVGDVLHLREWDPATEKYSGRDLYRVVTYLTAGGTWGLPENLCVMSIAALGTPVDLSRHITTISARQDFTPKENP